MHKLTRFHLSTLAICNAYLNIRHVIGLFIDWPDIFNSGGLRAKPNMTGKVGMKLAIVVSLCLVSIVCLMFSKNFF